MRYGGKINIANTDEPKQTVNRMITYSQVKIALSPIYYKKLVCDDNRTCLPTWL